MPTVRIVLDPRLGLSADDVVDAWNRDVAAGRFGVASIPDADESRDFSPTIEVVQVLVDLGVGVGSAVVYDALKDVVRRLRGHHRKVEVADVGTGEDGEAVIEVSEADDPSRP